MEALGSQHYRLHIRPIEGEQKSVVIRGDQWQLDARIVVWEGWLEWVSSRPFVRFERISGRYDALEDERVRERSVEAYHQEVLSLDVWGWLASLGGLPGLAIQYGSSVYVPMADGARYALYLSHQGLMVKADNTIAADKINRWD